MSNAKRTTRRGERAADAPSPEPVFVTAFFTRHGLAYFSMILRAFAEGGPAQIQRLTSAQTAAESERFDQYALIAKRPKVALPRGLSRAVLLVPAEQALDRRWVSTELEKLAPGDPPRLHSRLADSVKKEHSPTKAAVTHTWLTDIVRETGEADSPLDIAKRTMPAGAVLHDLWQIVNEFPLADQVAWWAATYGTVEGVSVEPIGDAGLEPEDPRRWARAVRDWIDRQPPECTYLVNLTGTSTHNQLAWYYLAATSPRLQDSSFCACTTVDPQREKRRFRSVSLKPVPKDLFRDLGETSFPTRLAPSDPRKRVWDWLEFYKERNDNFVIVLLGGRGSGKSRYVRDVFKVDGRAYEEANCALFGDDSLALSELFGHEEDAFTGAGRRRAGLFERANGGTLFLDEFHTLGPEVSRRLLTALQTNKDGFFAFRRLGGNQEVKVRFQLVLASNKPLKKLRKRFAPDFWDRVYQRVLTLPPFDKESELATGWRQVWEEMRFKGVPNPLDDPGLAPRFLDWLGRLPFPGNFRDLQRLAIRTADLQRASTRSKLLGEPPSAERPGWFSVLKHQIEQEARELAGGTDATVAVSAPKAEDRRAFRLPATFREAQGPTLDELERQFRRHLVDLLVQDYGTVAKAAAALKDRGGPSIATLGRWKRGGGAP